MQEDRLLKLITSNSESERVKAFDFLYKKCKLSAVKYLTSQGASEEEAEDIFQESIFILYKNVVVEHTFERKSLLSTYLFSICKFQWLNRIKLKARFDKEPLNDEQDYADEIDPYSQVCLERVNNIIRELSNPCQDLLIDYYFKKMSLKDIKKKVQLGSVQAVKNKKARCMKKLIEMVSGKKMKVEDFSYE